MRALCFFLIFLLFASPAFAGINLIRDAEVENTLKKYAEPVFLAAGLSPDAINLYIVNDESINAFVAGGQNLFINTGLITQCTSANMLIGVMAHETGHIAGGHIVKMSGKAENLSLEAVLATVLGAAVTVAGLPDAGIAVLGAGQHLAMRNFLSFSREQEVEADQYGINFLHSTKQSTQGMLDVMELLRRHQTLDFGAVDPYAISHPLSQDRISHIRAEASNEGNIKDDGFGEAHQRMVAKLYGFLENPDYTFSKYTGDDLASIYARSIAYYKKPDLAKALAEVDKLLKMRPNDPFFNELKGQFLAESGRPQEGLAYYKKADELYPGNYLLKLELGKLYASNGNPESAINELSKASKLEPQSSGVWRLLATSYGAEGNEGMASLMLAEEAKILDKKEEAKKYAKLAQEKLPKNSPALQRAQDIIADIKIQEKKDDDKSVFLSN